MRKLDEIRLKLTRLTALTSAVACSSSKLGPEHEQLQALATMAEEIAEESLELLDETIELAANIKIVRSA